MPPGVLLVDFHFFSAFRALWAFFLLLFFSREALLVCALRQRRRCSQHGALSILSLFLHRLDPPPHTHTSITMSLPDFSQAANLSKLDGFLADKSYVDG